MAKELDVLALKKLAEKARDAGAEAVLWPSKKYSEVYRACEVFKRACDPDTVLALIERLESAERMVDDQKEHYANRLAEAEAQLASLRAKMRQIVNNWKNGNIQFNSALDEVFEEMAAELDDKE